jgi:hypothetical protein
MEWNLNPIPKQQIKKTKIKNYDTRKSKQPNYKNI